MAHLIDKDALVSEIQKLHSAHSGKYGCDEVGLNLEYLEDFLDTFEVKEVDLDKECSQYFEGWTVQEDLGLTKSDGWSCIVKDLYDVAKHFFELGLQAQKGE